MATKKLVIEFTVDDEFENVEFADYDLNKYEELKQELENEPITMTKSHYMLFSVLASYVNYPLIASQFFKYLGNYLIEGNHTPPSFNETIPPLYNGDQYFNITFRFEGFDENKGFRNLND